MNKTQCKMARAGVGMSAKKLADTAGVHYATVARFELGATVAAESIDKMRKALTDAGADFTSKAGRSGVTVPD